MSPLRAVADQFVEPVRRDTASAGRSGRPPAPGTTGCRSPASARRGTARNSMKNSGQRIERPGPAVGNGRLHAVYPQVASSLRTSTTRRMPATISTTTITRTTALAAAGGYCRRGDLVLQRRDHRGALAAAHDLDDEEVAHHLRDHEDRAQRDAAFAQRQHDLAQDRPACWRRHRSPPRSAARSMRAIELKIGTIMNSVNRWT